MSKLNRRNALGLLAAAPAATLATPALAQSKIEWRMVTSWPKNLPGPGITAQRLADAITTMSDGRLTVKLYAAGELVPALEVFSAVSGGAAHMGHTASLFWGGKVPAAPLFTAGPFGLTPIEHITWINHGGGQAIWDKLYEPFGIKPFMAGNTGFQMGGWYKKELKSVSDLAGLKIRMPGLGGEVMRLLGASPVTLAPGEILSALQTGVIDATEFLGPSSDFAMGFYKAAKFYYAPGFHEPNGTGEALVSKEALAALPADLQAIVQQACAAENILALGESEWMNAARLKTLVEEKGVMLRDYPADILEAAAIATEQALDDLAAKDPLTAEAVASFRGASAHLKDWSTQSVQKFLAARS
ncbi:MAG: TRAP transporter substrate-binding protein [Rhizobiaceae bacterium]|nr:TRAP transporter substrate-binding protein [Hyphomicrobiales bacterium]NRB30873.1 TRAP transporter substrate-binding protein [Rhizobiaceae bacterium]